MLKGEAWLLPSIARGLPLISHAGGWTVKSTSRDLLSRQPTAGHISKWGEASKRHLTSLPVRRSLNDLQDCGVTSKSPGKIC
jgi:hypothetical protein